MSHPPAAEARQGRAATRRPDDWHDQIARPDHFHGIEAVDADRAPSRCARWRRLAGRARRACAGRPHLAPDRRFLGPRQDHRPHHLVRGRVGRDGAVRLAADHREGLLHAARHRGAADHQPSRRSTRSTPRSSTSGSFQAGCSLRAPASTASSIPVYDVWLTDCKGGKEVQKTPETASAEPSAGDKAPDAAKPDDAGKSADQAPKPERKHRVARRRAVPAPDDNGAMSPDDAPRRQPPARSFFPDAANNPDQGFY